MTATPFLRPKASKEELETRLKDLHDMKDFVGTKKYEEDWVERVAKEPPLPAHLKDDPDYQLRPLQFYRDAIENHIKVCKGLIADLEDGDE